MGKYIPNTILHLPQFLFIENGQRVIFGSDF